MADTIQIRGATNAWLVANDPILRERELLIDVDTDLLYLGDGVTAWSGLTALNAGGGGGGGALSDGDYGDITVSGSGTVMTIDADAVTYAKMQNVSATDKVLGRSTAGAGDVEEITCTATGRSIIAGANAAAVRTTIGVTQACVRTPLAGFDGQGSVVSAGSKFIIPILYTGTIVKWRLVGSVSRAAATGSAVCDIWKATYSTSTLPTVANTITASAKPTISSATAAESSTLTGWTTSVSAGDMLIVNVDSCSTFTELVLVIEIDTTT